MTTMHAYFRLKCVLPVIFLSVLSSFQNGGRPCQFLNSKRSFVSFLFLAWLLSIIGVSAPFIYFTLILWKFMTSWTMNSNMHMHIHILGVHCIHYIYISFSFQLGGVDTTSGHQLLCKIIPWIQNEIGTSEFDHIQFPSHCSDFKIFFSFQDNWMLFITTFHSFQLMDSCSCSFVLDNWMLFITTLQSFQLMDLCFISSG